MDTLRIVPLYFFFCQPLTNCTSRPSEALALAVRVGAPVYADESILDKAGIFLDAETGKPIVEDEAVSLLNLTSTEFPHLTTRPCYIANVLERCSDCHS